MDFKVQTFRKSRRGAEKKPEPARRWRWRRCREAFVSELSTHQEDCHHGNGPRRLRPLPRTTADRELECLMQTPTGSLPSTARHGAKSSLDDLLCSYLITFVFLPPPPCSPRPSLRDLCDAVSSLCGPRQPGNMTLEQGLIEEPECIFIEW